jgi:hypothetical protein
MSSVIAISEPCANSLVKIARLGGRRLSPCRNAQVPRRGAAPAGAVTPSEVKSSKTSSSPSVDLQASSDLVPSRSREIGSTATGRNASGTGRVKARSTRSAASASRAPSERRRAVGWTWMPTRSIGAAATRSMARATAAGTVQLSTRMATRRRFGPRSGSAGKPTRFTGSG